MYADAMPTTARKPAKVRTGAKKKVTTIRVAPARKPRVTARAAKSAASAKTKASAPAAAISDEAVARATGRGWEEWYAILDAFAKGAATTDHSAAAAHIYDEHACPAWWSQMVTV